MKNRYLLIIFFIHSLLTLGQQNDVTTIRQNIKEVEWNTIEDVNELDTQVYKLLQTINTQNTWDDVDINAQTRTIWPPIKHLGNIQKIALAYSYPESNYHQDQKILRIIIKGLNYWIEKKPRSKNKWFMTIATPKVLGLIMVLIDAKKTITTELQDSIVQLMTPINSFGTGANLVDTAIHLIYRAAALKDTILLYQASKLGFKPIKIHQEYGIQHDLSFLQHDAQLHIASYGSVFLHGEIKIMKYLKNTSYQVKKDQLKLFSDFALKTYANSIRGKFMDFNVVGRAISRPNNIDINHMKSLFYDLKLLDTLRKPLYTQVIDRITTSPFQNLEIQPVSHKYFWRADYTIHNRPNYLASVRTSSTRTIKSERLNDENNLGYFLTEGATPIMVNGNEYYNIFPIWDWTKIPGVTAPNYDLPIIRKHRWTFGKTDFVGGVTDGIYGATTYLLDDFETKAKKSWFFFDNEIVCLGTGITSTSNKEVNTTMNQSWLDGPVIVKEKGKIKTMQKEQLISNKTEWVLHDSIAYYFPKYQNVHISKQTQKGNWHSINYSQSKDSLSEKVFKLYIDHEIKPSKQEYEYIILPSVISKKTIKNYPIEQLEILSNTGNLQAVYHKKLDILQAICYTPGTYSLNGHRVTVDKPCALILKNTLTESPKLYLSDPSQKHDFISIHITLAQLKRSVQHTIALPKFPYSGSTRAISL